MANINACQEPLNAAILHPTQHPTPIPLQHRAQLDANSKELAPTVKAQTYFLEDTAEIDMDLSSDHFFSDLQLENTFLSSTAAGLYTQTDPISAELQLMDTMMPNTIYNLASVFGKDPIAEKHLFETPPVNTPPATEIQSRKLFYNIHAQQPSDSVAQVNGPVTCKTTAAALKKGLSSIQESRLHSTAMPSTSYMSPKPASSSGSPPAVTTWSSQRKRKSSDSNDENTEDESPLNRRSYHRRYHAPVKKTAHSIIEKRYRTNLNDKIATLRDCVPSLRDTINVGIGSVKKAKRDIADNLQKLIPVQQLNKATIFSKATEYILDLEKRNKTLCEENAAYKGRMEDFKITMLTNKNRNTITTTTANTPPMLAIFTSSPGSSPSGSGSFDSTISATSI
ncbi:hypothetical protein F5884DRAFT_874952 [Xylogone sp. PMI_703]|nr:hypothetical protein F5884DRAFT_874952 [Xylogone sp. PMI_703]